MLRGTMRRLHLLLLASLQLCRARQPGFSIHDDMLAYPQVRVFICAKSDGKTDKYGNSSR